MFAHSPVNRLARPATRAVHRLGLAGFQRAQVRGSAREAVVRVRKGRAGVHSFGIRLQAETQGADAVDGEAPLGAGSGSV